MSPVSRQQANWLELVDDMKSKLTSFIALQSFSSVDSFEGVLRLMDTLESLEVRFHLHDYFKQPPKGQGGGMDFGDFFDEEDDDGF